MAELQGACEAAPGEEQVMDIYCKVCGEPWDHDELHEMYVDGRKVPYMEAWRRFKKMGCRAFGSSHGDQVDKEAAEMASVLYGVGDDPDAAAAFFEDFLS